MLACQYSSVVLDTFFAYVQISVFYRMGPGCALTYQWCSLYDGPPVLHVPKGGQAMDQASRWVPLRKSVQRHVNND
jgi:hypothetical protein